MSATTDADLNTSRAFGRPRARVRLPGVPTVGAWANGDTHLSTTFQSLAVFGR